MSVLRLDAVCKRWDASSGLEPVSLAIDPGQVVVVKGRSGSGKSTLLAILAGWCPPDSGTIERSGGWATGGGWRAWRHTAIVPQVLATVAELSVAENIEAPLRLAGRDRKSIKSEVAAIAARLDLVEQLPRQPGEISAGQQQRLAVARAVIIGPTLLLADEPTSHQDARHAATVVDVVRDAAAAGSAVLVASHEPLVIAAADTVIDLDR